MTHINPEVRNPKQAPNRSHGRSTVPDHLGSRIQHSPPRLPRPLACFCFLLSAFCFQAWGQSYSIDWATIDGGGGTSTGGVYSVSGTIGQPDAGTMSGGNYALVGGFWGIIAAVQTPGAPYLTITRTNNTVVVSWPLPDTGWKLQATTNLVTNGSVWTELPPPYATNVTSLYFVEPWPVGNQFFRLHKP